jgi:NOL1/NOP2/fmu family ribosome biogenesis protein
MENEETVAAFLQRHPDFEPEAVDAPWFTPCGVGMFRLWPHKLKGEGHFAAVLRRRGEDEGDVPPAKAEKLPKEWLSFARELGIELPEGRPVMFGQSLYWAPSQMPDIGGLKVLRPGLELGVVKKDRFEPAHALALWLEDCANVHSVPADSREAAAYLHGEVIPSQKRGWCLVKVDDFPIGWGKGDGNMLKNHYPKGIRR